MLSAEARAARLDEDLARLKEMGANTVVGWEAEEFDEVLFDLSHKHGLGVIPPFPLDPAMDYTDPHLRADLTERVLAWVDRFRNHPALRMWGLGNEVLHKIVHPSWVGPQDPERERNARAFAAWLVETADRVHAVDPDHPVTYREAEDAYALWVAEALRQRGGGPRPWFVWGTNCYTEYLERVVASWPERGMDVALWVSEFHRAGLAVPDRPEGFRQMWGYIRRNSRWVLGGAVYAWTRNGPEEIDRAMGLTDDGRPVDGRSLEALSELFHVPDEAPRSTSSP